MKRIIVLSVSLGLIAAIAVATILMALIPTGSIPNIAKPDLYVWVATVDTGSNFTELRGKTATDARDQEVIDEIWEEFVNAPKQKSITALFNGTIGEEIEYKVNTGNKYESIRENDEDKAIIVFVYSEPQYVDEKGNPTTEDAENKVEYDAVLMEISAKDERTEVVVKIGEYKNKQVYVNASYTMNGNFSALYEVVTNLKTAA